MLQRPWPGWHSWARATVQGPLPGAGPSLTLLEPEKQRLSVPFLLTGTNLEQAPQAGTQGLQEALEGLC